MTGRGLTVSVALVLGVIMQVISISAGEVSPTLEASLRTASPPDEIAIIIELADRTDIESLVFPTKSTRRRGVVSTLRARAIIAESTVRAFLDSVGATRVRSLWAIGAIAARVPARDLDELAGLRGVAEVRLDRRFELSRAAPKLAADPEWNLEMIGAPDLWARGLDGSGVVLAVVDSGVDVAHQDLSPRWRGGENSWFDPHGEHQSPHDADGHGTQAAGLAVGGDATGTAIGVSPGARWIAGKVFDDAGWSDFSATHEIFQWLLDPDGDPATDDAPDVVNNSWGFPNLPGECVDEFAQDIQVLRAAGIAVVFSAGNNGPSSATSLSPGNNAGAFSVGGSDGSDEVMNSSSRGPSACGGGLFPTLVAPGDGIRTADLTLGGVFPTASTEVGGTSAAAPHVTGAMALLLEAHPQATVDQLEEALRVGAEDLGPDGPDNDSGHGRLDVVTAEAALDALVGGGGNPMIYTDEAAYLAAISGQDSVSEGFEDDVAWGDARSPVTAPTVSSQGMSWASNHADNDVTTGGGAARTGDWGFYSLPHGDQNLTQPMDFITDGFTGSGDVPMNSVGGWFVGTSGARLSLILDGDEANAVELGPVGIFHSFLGAVVDGSFSSFEFRETEGTVEDPKLIFVDDITIGLPGGGANRPPEGSIVRPATDVTVSVGEPVFFEGSATDPDGDTVSALWDFGDGSSSTLLVPGDRAYTVAGSYAVSFTVTDHQGLPDPTPDSRQVTVIDPPATPPTGVVAGVANVPGELGSDWHTDVYLHNAAAADASVLLTFSPANGIPGSPVALTVQPDQTLALVDVVASVFGTTGSGAIGWTVASGDPDSFFVSANTYNRVDDTRRYGQQVPGVRWVDVSPGGTSTWLPALAGPYRTNLGVATDETCSRVRIRGYDRSGAQVAQRVLDVQPLTWIQLNGIFRNVFPDLVNDPDGVPLVNSVHRFEVIGENGRVVTYTSIIDNQTSDGSYMLGQTSTEGPQTAWLPGVALISGTNDSRWRSDVILMHIGADSDTTTFGFFDGGSLPGGPVDTRDVNLGAGGSTVEEDILHGLFGYQPPAVGSLSTASPDTADAVIWMRTYTEEPITGGDVKTYGQAIGPRGPNSMVTFSTPGLISGFSHDGTTRSNLVFQNTRFADGEYLASAIVVDVVSADGQTLHQQTYELGPGEYRQHNRFIDDYGIGALTTGALRVTVTTQGVQGETGGVDAMVSEVNGNTLEGTNDGRLIRAEVLP